MTVKMQLDQRTAKPMDAKPSGIATAMLTDSTWPDLMTASW